MRNTTQIEDALKDLILKDDKEFVAMLSGEWGIGKTYFWKAFTKEYLKDKDVVYISLFGKNSLVDIETEILTKLSRFNQFKEQNKTILSWLKKATSFASNSSGFPVNIASGAILSLFSSNDFENIVICFDDFERLSDKVSLKDVMGLISQFKEQKECKVIMILNEKELDKLSDIDGKKHDEIFALYKEKVVNYNFHYQPSQEELFQAIKEDIKEITFCEHQTIYDFFKETDLRNIRIMKQALYLLEKFSFIESKRYDKKVINEFVEIALNLFVFKAKSNYTYSEFCDFTSYTPYDEQVSDAKIYNDEKSKIIKNEKHEKNLPYYSENKSFSIQFDSLNKDLIEQYIYQYIDYLKLEKEQITKLLDENNNTLSRYTIRDTLYEKNKQLFIDFQISNQTIVEELYRLLEQNKKDMPNLFAYKDFKSFIKHINLFTQQDTKTLEKEIIKYYLNKHKFDNFYDKTVINPIRLIVQDYLWAQKYIDSLINSQVVITLEDTITIMNDILKYRHISKEHSIFLSNITPQDYISFIKSSSSFVELLIKFTHNFHAYSELKISLVHIRKALTSLKEENNDFAWKIKQISKNGQIKLEEKNNEN